EFLSRNKSFPEGVSGPHRNSRASRARRRPDHVPRIPSEVESPRRREAVTRAAISLLCLAAAVPWVHAQHPNFEKTAIQVLPVQGNVYLLASPLGNVTVQVGKTGVLLVDTSYPEMTGKLLAAIRKLSDKPVRYIINTHVHADHTGGNENFAKAFGSATEVSVVNTPGSTATQTVQIYAHDNVLARMTKPDSGHAAAPDTAWPTETFIGNQKELYFNGEAVLMSHEPAEI